MRKNRKRAGERQERMLVSIVFNTIFRYTSPYDWSILAVGVNTAFALAESDRHDERVKPSYTHFFTHILVRAIFPSGSALVSGRNKIFKDAYKLCPSLFPQFFAVPPTFFSRLL